MSSAEVRSQEGEDAVLHAGVLQKCDAVMAARHDLKGAQARLRRLLKVLVGVGGTVSIVLGRQLVRRAGQLRNHIGHVDALDELLS
jgi:hypothetical protein